MSSDQRRNTIARLSTSELEKRRTWGENNINAGRLREFPWISIDKFHGEHLQATIFILSHCHTDHMVGLEEDGFWHRLNQPGIKLYLHRLTLLLLPLCDMHYLRGEEGIKLLLAKGKLVFLETHQPIDIFETITQTTVRMTFLPAGHCPGSVMFQFEYDDECILYTGDCRISKNDLKKMDSLHTSTGRRAADGTVENKLKTITHLYIDTTFCSSRSQDFPERTDAVEKLVETITNWLEISSNNYVNLKFSAKFSHEYVLLECYKRFKIQYHVNEQRYNAYREIPKLFEAVTLNPNTKFHLCQTDSECLINCTTGGTRGRILQIKLSSLWYMKNNDYMGPTLACKYDEASRLVTICYAMHSSLDEIAAIVDYLKPKVVTPLVLPKGMPRKELERQLRLSAFGNFRFEDYEDRLKSRTVLNVKTKPGTHSQHDNRILPIAGGNCSLSDQGGDRKRIKRQIRWNPSPSPPPY